MAWALVLGLVLVAGCGEDSKGKPRVADKPSAPQGRTEPNAEPPPPPPGPATLVVESDPPGAQVEVGLKMRGGVVKPGTGRIVGKTPCKVVLRDSDVNSLGGITVWLRKPGYRDHSSGLSDGRKKIKAGGEYKLSERPLKMSRLQ